MYGSGGDIMPKKKYMKGKMKGKKKKR